VIKLKAIAIANAVCVDGRVRNLVDKLETFHQPGHHGFADPAQGQADHRDAQPGRRFTTSSQLLMETLNDARANAARTR